ncbi:MAG: GNAT family N-acetyltransferase [Flavobacteriales bacterium]
MIDYQVEEHLSADEFRELLIKSTLGERRPVDDPDRMEAMVRNANLTITARLDGKLVGVARSLTDFVYCTYLSDLAVDEAHQGRGIGRTIAAPGSPPQAMRSCWPPQGRAYYPHRHGRAPRVLYAHRPQRPMMDVDLTPDLDRLEWDQVVHMFHGWAGATATPATWRSFEKLRVCVVRENGRLVAFGRTVATASTMP